MIEYKKVVMKPYESLRDDDFAELGKENWEHYLIEINENERIYYFKKHAN